MNFEHIMLDLETLSSKKNAFIIAIGAVRFDLDTFEVASKNSENTFYEIVDSSKSGLLIDFDTVKWWMGQSVEAQSIFHLPGRPLPEALGMFHRFVRQTDPVRTMIWGNGATFDNVVLRSAYEAYSLDYPGSYKNDMCYRTMRKQFLGLMLKDETPVGVSHNALDDAYNQAVKLVQIFKALKAPSAI